MIKNSGLYDTIMVIITNSKGYSEVIPITKIKLLKVYSYCQLNKLLKFNRLSIQREPIFIIVNHRLMLIKRRI